MLTIGFASFVDFTLPGKTLTGGQFVADVRPKVESPVLLGRLSSQDGTIEVLSAEEIRLHFPAAMSKPWPRDVVFVDVGRIDGAEPEHWGFVAKLTFLRGPTRL